jgi:hypothetical protein
LVKKLISGLLKKKEKEEAKESKPAEDVPEELPPLAEDILKKKGAEGEEKTEQGGEKGTLEDLEKEGAPPELPPLDIKRESKEGEKEEEKKEELEEIKKELGPDESSLKSKAATEDYSKEKAKEEAEIGFFSNILEHIKKHDGFKEKLLAGDLFSRMSNYWELKKNEIKGGVSVPLEQQLEEELKEKLEKLKILEKKWQVQKLALEEDLKFLHEREAEIQLAVKELKAISNKLNLFKKVKPEQYFYLHNGVVLKSLHDLIDALEIMDKATFKHHVTKNRNDFSEWVKHVFKNRNLAEKIKKAKTKEEMIGILETEPFAKDKSRNNHKKLPPRKYFWLANGAVIKSLEEFLDALKVMDDELFGEHVNKDRNDFSNWVKHVLKNEHLGERLEKAKTREEMISIMEISL